MLTDETKRVVQNEPAINHVNDAVTEHDNQPNRDEDLDRKFMQAKWNGL